MKPQYMINLTFAACMVMSMTGCSDDDSFTVIDAEMQSTETYFNSGESYKSDLYLKPYVGYVGDPMPFYDTNTSTFKILYLHDMRNGNSTIYHPAHELETKDGSEYINYNEAIACGGAEEDDPALGTGSTVMVNGRYYTFYTGHKAASPREVILKAVSDDGVVWTKDRSFRLQAPAGYNADEFRDPYVFYDEEAGLYRMVIAAIKNGSSVLAQFTSTDLAVWTEQEPFFQNKWGRFYECPDVFKMGDWWYLVYSDKDITRQVQYFYARSLNELMNMGSDPQFPWRDEGKLEGMSFYAGKTAGDGQNRYIWGWCATREGDINENDMDWAGALVMHKLVQNEDGTLGFTVPDAIAAKFGKTEELKEMRKIGAPTGNSATGYTMSAGQSVRFARLNYQNKIEFDVKVENPGTAVFGLSFADCSDLDYNYRVYIEDRWDNLKFDKVTTPENGEAEERANINAFSFIHPDDGQYHVTMISDQSVCVVYINNQYAFTNRIYGIQRNPWSLFCSDGTIEVSNISLKTY